MSGLPHSVMPGLLPAFFVAALGAIVGSYLNVVIHRLPRGQSTITPRSRCPSCGRAIRAADNVPVLSFLLLRGRCRSCGATIPWRYPFVEGATAVLFLLSWWSFGGGWSAAVAAVFCSLLVALAGIDLEHFLLLDVLTLPGLLFGLVAGPLSGLVSWRGAVLGALVGGGFLLAVRQLWLWLRREEGMGLGDVKMLAMIGAFVGWQGVVVTFFFASLAGTVVGLGWIVFGAGDLKGHLPFGVFLALGAVIALFAGPELVAAYGQLL